MCCVWGDDHERFDLHLFDFSPLCIFKWDETGFLFFYFCVSHGKLREETKLSMRPGTTSECWLCSTLSGCSTPVLEWLQTIGQGKNSSRDFPVTVESFPISKTQKMTFHPWCPIHPWSILSSGLCQDWLPLHCCSLILPGALCQGECQGTILSVLTRKQNKLAKLRDAIAISKTETINHSPTHSLTDWLTGVGARRCYRILFKIGLGRVFSKSLCSQTLHNSLNGWDQGAGDPSNPSIPSTTVPPQSLKCYFIKICYAIGQVLRGYAQDDKLSLLLSTLVCVSSCVCSNILGQNRQRRTGCICLTFLHCAFSNVSSNRLPMKIQSHIGCIC